MILQKISPGWNSFKIFYDFTISSVYLKSIWDYMWIFIPDRWAEISSSSSATGVEMSTHYIFSCNQKFEINKIWPTEGDGFLPIQVS